MLRLITLAALLSLTGCQQPTERQPDNAAELQNAQTQIERLEKEKADLIAEKAKTKPAAKTAKAKPDIELDQDYEGDEMATAAPSRSLCWQDYCPCESPETALDTTICRNARGGIEMSDDQWAIGAQARDSKREGDRLNREMDGIISEMEGKRY